MHININDFTSFASLGMSFVTLLFMLITFGKNGKKDQKTEFEKEDAKYDSLKEGILRISTSVDALCALSNETRLDLKSANKDMVNIQKHLVSIDERLVSMDKRLCDVEDAVYNKK